MVDPLSPPLTLSVTRIGNLSKTPGRPRRRYHWRAITNCKQQRPTDLLNTWLPLSGSARRLSAV
eukprot:213333-Heterocapsa_arctica.AAC.1